MKTQITLFIIAAGCLLFLSGCGSDLPPEVRADPNEVQELRTKFASLASADAGATEQVAGPTGYATLTGQFTLIGDVPAKSTTNVTKDPTICAPNGNPVPVDDIVVDGATKGIANILVYTTIKNESWINESAKTAAEEEVLFDQKNCIFLKRVVAMQTTQKLKVLNSDPVGHNLNVKNFNKTIEPGRFLYFEPTKEDKLPTQMSCSIHPWMKAYFLGRNDGYFAITNPDGSFEIPNLPAGVALEFRVWHERATSINQDITVNGSSEKWKKGKFIRTFQPDVAVELKVALDSSLFN